MKVLLTTLNSKYIHSSLALKYLQTFAHVYKDYIFVKEYTINNWEDFIISDIYKFKPDIVCFSCYIWNIDFILSIIKNLRNILPKTIFILGGPEVSYNSEDIVKKGADIVVLGEGELAFLNIMDYYIGAKSSLYAINGITFMAPNGKIIKNIVGKNLSLEQIPFVYDDGFEDLSNKIIYYETSRGCPFSCSYCMSSLEGPPRFLSIEKAKVQLKYFIENKVKQVKFIDRTFNCNKNYASELWEYIINNDNGITNFHFEIAADLLDKQMLNILKTARPGLFQMEIGVQSTNIETLKEINRKTDLEKLFENTHTLLSFKNIHIHTDLIAGLPFENYFSFIRSFNDVFSLNSHQIQLGFLKLLHGSSIRQNKEKYGIVHKYNAPYEIYYNNDISYDEMLEIKKVEEMVEIFYNSNDFKKSVKYLLAFFDSPYLFFKDLGDYWFENGYNESPKNKRFTFEVLLDYAAVVLCCDYELIKNLIKFDILLSGNAQMRPMWAETHLTHEEKHFANIIIRNFPGNEHGKIGRKLFVEKFDYNVFTMTKENIFIFFDYFSSTDPLDGSCNYCILKISETGHISYIKVKV